MGLSIISPGQQTEPDLIIGIDLGTTFSLAAHMAGDGPKLVRDEQGDARVPSAIGFEPDGTVRIGFEVRRRAQEDPRHCVYSVKRLIGKTLDELQAELAYVPYQVVEREMVSGRKALHVRIEDHEHTPEELSAIILREVAARAAQKLGKPVRKVVVTVPAYFDESQRQATRDAGRIAGLDVVRIVNEPTAAALAYGLHQKQEGTIAVYDFGGGTFDCSILSLRKGVFKVLSTHGDTHLGGDDVDLALLKHFEPQLPDGLDPAEPTVRQTLREACERLKIALTDQDRAELSVDFGEKTTLHATLTRSELERLIEPLVDRTIASCRAALRDAELTPADVEEVVLVGGSSRLSLVRSKVAELFGRKPQCELNPDEVVAMGAAVQASILAGQNRQILLLDITPLSLGIETLGGAVSRLIARNSTIPAVATERFTTYVDNQTGVDIHVVQGERELAKDCRSLGKFKLTGIPPMPANLPQIDVTFTINADGMLQVSATENKSGQQAGIEIQPSQGLSRDEVEQMIRDSIEHAKEDFEQRRLVDLQTKADADIRHTQKGLAQAGGQLTSQQRAEVDQSLASLEAAKQRADVDALQQALDAFEEATQPLAELLMNRVLESEVVNKRLSDV